MEREDFYAMVKQDNLQVVESVQWTGLLGSSYFVGQKYNGEQISGPSSGVVIYAVAYRKQPDLRVSSKFYLAH